MRKRLIITLVLVTIGLGSIYVLPKAPGLQDAAVYTVLPTSVGEWKGTERAAGELEKRELDKATNFKKMFYSRKSPNHAFEWDTADMTMVLSGDDMNNSIHRPERCLLAQGFKDIAASEVAIDVGVDRPLKVTRLHSVMRLEDGSTIPSIMYYWFVGADVITNSHYGRTFYDMKFRLLSGTNQRWAYISVQAPYGEIRREGWAPNTEAQTDQALQDVVAETFNSVHNIAEIKGWRDAKKPEVATK
ncbi:MAG: hypothetical protein ACI8XO_000434 [Verrucomicrobiales bacterium]|jgi:hypothetical protein